MIEYAKNAKNKDVEDITATASGAAHLPGSEVIYEIYYFYFVIYAILYLLYRLNLKTSSGHIL